MEKMEGKRKGLLDTLVERWWLICEFSIDGRIMDFLGGISKGFICNKATNEFPFFEERDEKKVF